MGSFHNCMQELLIKPRHSNVVSEERLMKWGREGEHPQRILQTIVFWASSQDKVKNLQNAFLFWQSRMKRSYSPAHCEESCVITYFAAH